MELRQLRAFLQVANARHFGKAAAALRITQPALTQRIQALERELGVQLLTRSAREVRLTPAGEILLPYATSLIQVEDRAIRDLADNASGRTGKLRVAYLLHGDIATQGRIVAEYRRRYSDVAVETSMSYSSANLGHVGSGEVDAAFIVPMELPPNVEVKSIGRRALMLAIPTDHPLAKLDPVPASSLRGVPIILWPHAWNPRVSSSFRQWVTRHTGEEPNIVAEEPTEQAFEALAMDGSAVALASSWRASAATITGVVFRPLDPQPLLEHQIAYLREDPSPTLQQLLRITDEILSANHATPVEGELL
ncbi:MAG TPA: LysR family transcriptional regulator [Dehalococcoidia bacterium]|jgi:DNA-binding transcriptional LysR family regulator|nr:LysR family transcriptional regulator [Dehalococcoidia bacterium]